MAGTNVRKNKIRKPTESTSWKNHRAQLSCTPLAEAAGTQEKRRDGGGVATVFWNRGSPRGYFLPLPSRRFEVGMVASLPL